MRRLGDGWLFEQGEAVPPEVMAEIMSAENLAKGEAMITRLHALRDTFEDDTGQVLYSSAMLPCPFCGAGSDGPGRPRPWVQTSDALSGGWEARVVCGGCHVSTPREYVGGPVTYLPTGEDITRLLAVERAVAAWNRRADAVSSAPAYTACAPGR